MKWPKKAENFLITNVENTSISEIVMCLDSHYHLTVSSWQLFKKIEELILSGQIRPVYLDNFYFRPSTFINWPEKPLKQNGKYIYPAGCMLQKKVFWKGYMDYFQYKNFDIGATVRTISAAMFFLATVFIFTTKIVPLFWKI